MYVYQSLYQSYNTSLLMYKEYIISWTHFQEDFSWTHFHITCP
nr:MAG TPA: hypothetical protein [Caudoviricetes sp.]